MICDQPLSSWSDGRAQCRNYSRILGTRDIQLHNAGSHNFHTFIHIYIIDIDGTIIRISNNIMCVLFQHRVDIHILLIIALIHFARVLKITE